MSSSARQLDRILTAGFRDAGVDGGGLSVLATGGDSQVLFASDDVASAVEHLQFTLGQGPCVDASSSGTAVLVADLDDPGDRINARWPAFGPEAAQVGVRAIFAFPVRIGAIALGAIDMYRLSPGELSEPQLGSALSTVDAVSLAVLDMHASTNPGAAESASLVVHQAAGMVMVQLEASIEEALVRIRGTAFAEGAAIDALASDIVHRRRRLSKEER